MKERGIGRAACPHAAAGKWFFAACVAALASGAWAVPEVQNVGIAQDGARLVTVTYDLTEPAIVTVAFATNGIALPAAETTVVGGDVNQYVEKASGAIWWRPPANLSGALSAQVTAWTKDEPPLYFAIDLMATNSQRYYASAEAVPGGVTNTMYKGDKMLFRRIPGKNVTWLMGATGEDSSYEYRETPHWVTFTNDWYLAVYELTRRQYARLTVDPSLPNTWKVNTSSDPRAEFWPCENVSNLYVLRGSALPTNGHEEVEGCLKTWRGRFGLMFDLPTDAEWEYSCRAGVSSAFNNGDDKNGAHLDEIAWHYGNTYDEAIGARRPHEVGTKKPNAWGLYDMHGNMLEYVIDRLASTTEEMPSTSVTNPVRYAEGGTSVDWAIRRGGAFASTAGSSRSAYRNSASYNGTQYSGARLWLPVPMR